MEDNNILDIKSIKDKKKYEQAVKDLESILKIIELAQRSLYYYRQYIAAQEIVSVLATNYTILEIQKNRYETELQKIKEKNS